ncbi:MAG: hypothetical protein P1U34_01390 [Coxiellaceae bacterium]|nr:hypothetical protein [Coxiellaceae bacterium]
MRESLDNTAFTTFKQQQLNQLLEQLALACSEKVSADQLKDGLKELLSTEDEDAIVNALKRAGDGIAMFRLSVVIKTVKQCSDEERSERMEELGRYFATITHQIFCEKQVGTQLVQSMIQWHMVLLELYVYIDANSYIDAYKKIRALEGGPQFLRKCQRYQRYQGASEKNPELFKAIVADANHLMKAMQIKSTVKKVSGRRHCILESTVKDFHHYYLWKLNWSKEMWKSVAPSAAFKFRINCCADDYPLVEDAIQAWLYQHMVDYLDDPETNPLLFYSFKNVRLSKHLSKKGTGYGFLNAGQFTIYMVDGLSVVKLQAFIDAIHAKLYELAKLDEREVIAVPCMDRDIALKTTYGAATNVSMRFETYKGKLLHSGIMKKSALCLEIFHLWQQDKWLYQQLNRIELARKTEDDAIHRALTDMLLEVYGLCEHSKVPAAGSEYVVEMTAKLRQLQQKRWLQEYDQRNRDPYVESLADMWSILGLLKENTRLMNGYLKNCPAPDAFGYNKFVFETFEQLKSLSALYRAYIKCWRFKQNFGDNAVYRQLLVACQTLEKAYFKSDGTLRFVIETEYMDKAEAATPADDTGGVEEEKQPAHTLLGGTSLFPPPPMSKSISESTGISTCSSSSPS